MNWKILLIVYMALVTPKLGFAGQPIGCAQATTPSLNVPQTQMEKVLHWLFAEGAKDFSPADNFAQMILALPRETQKKWVSAIGAIYKKTSKDRAGGRVSARRLLDRVLTLVERDDLQFQEDLKSGLSPREAYAAFLERQREMASGDYSINEVWALVTSLQAELAKYDERLGDIYASLRMYQGQTPKPGKVTLVGSYVNGKASESSDLDVMMDNEHHIRDWIHFKTSLKVEYHVKNEQFFGGLQPMALEITATQVNLLVFAPGGLQRVTNVWPRGSISREDVISTEPTVYRLD
jgi:predicted nucleotidyltransferase